MGAVHNTLVDYQVVDWNITKTD